MCGLRSVCQEVSKESDIGIVTSVIYIDFCTSGIVEAVIPRDEDRFCSGGVIYKFLGIFKAVQEADG